MKVDALEYIDDDDELLQTTLSGVVRQRYRAAHDAKMSSCVIDEIEKAFHQRKGEFTPEEACKIPDGLELYANITETKCWGAESWVRDILMNSGERPWTVDPTPYPDLPDIRKEAIADRIEAKLAELSLTGTDPGGLDLLKAVEEERNKVMREIREESQECAHMLEDKIEDILLESNWRNVFVDVITDAITYPAGIMKGPVVQMERKLRWENNKPKVKWEEVLNVERVSPRYFYPSPDSTDCQDGAYVVERKTLSKQQLCQMAELPGFNQEIIQDVLDEFNTGYRDWLDTSHEPEAHGTTQAPLWDWGQGIDCLEYWGVISGQELKDAGVEGIKEDELVKNFECEIWVISDHVIRAVKNPHPEGKRPYHHTSFRKCPGQFWGRGLPEVMRWIQRLVNSATRSLILNNSHSAGSFYEYDPERIMLEYDVETFEPWSLIPVEDDNRSGHPAIKEHATANYSTQFMGQLQQFIRMADDVSGVPAYTMGDPAVAGAGRTASGLSQLMSNAAKNLRHFIGNVGDDVIGPMIGQYHTYIMLNDPDDSIKCDSTVSVRSLEGIIKREMMADATSTVIQDILPFVGDPELIPKSGLQVLLRDYLRQRGFDPERIIPDSNADADLAALVEQLGGQAGVPPAAGAPPAGPPGAPPPIPGGPPALPPEGGPPQAIPPELAEG